MKLFLLILLLAAIFILGPFIVGAIWTWVVTDVFAGAVAQNLLPATLTWAQALKLMLLLSVLSLTRSGLSSKK